MTSKDLYRVATSLYNASVHSVTKLKPVEVFFGIKDGDERPLNLDTILANRNEIFDDVVNRITDVQNKTLDRQNRSRENEPNLEENETVYRRIQGIKNKRQPKFKRTKVRSNRRKTFIDHRDVKIHKTKIKRKRKT